MEPSASTASVLSNTFGSTRDCTRGQGSCATPATDKGDEHRGGSMARRPLAWWPPFTRGKEENGAKMLVLSLPSVPSLSFFPPTSAKPLVALRFAGDAQDGTTAKVAVAIATAPDPGPPPGRAAPAPPCAAAALRRCRRSVLRGRPCSGSSPRRLPHVCHSTPALATRRHACSPAQPLLYRSRTRS